MAYSIHFESDPPLLRLTFSGFWDQETFMRFAQDFQTKVRDIVATHPHFDTFADATDFPVQGIDIAQGFEYLKQMAHAACPTARTAIVFGSTLTKLQAKREVLDDSMQTFATESEALAWLDRVPAL